ncbi:hypothetical protein QTV44_002469 [Vibrio vulnificus]|nr:hypothetical protein [Vibrio vulnificus]
MSNKITEVNKASIKGFIKELNNEGFAAKRKDALSIPFDSIDFTPEWNIRPIDINHARNIANALRNGETVDAIEVVLVDTANGKRAKIVDGHHTYTAYQILINEGISFELIPVIPFKGSDNECLVRAYKTTLSKPLTRLQRAKLIQRLSAGGMSFKEIEQELNISKSVRSNDSVLLRGDADLHDLIESGKIADTRAIELIRTYGENATKYAKLEIGLASANSFDEVEIVNLKPSHHPVETISGELVVEAGEVSESITLPQSSPSISQPRIAAKKVTKQGLKPKKLSAGKQDDLNALVLIMAQKLNGNTIELPEPLMKRFETLTNELASIEMYNKSLTEL